MDQTTAVYKAELDKRLEFDRWYAEQKKAIDNKANQEEAASWRTTNNELEAAESSFISDVLTKRQKLSTDLVQIGAKLLLEEITNEAKYWTERELLALEGVTSQKAIEQAGVFARLTALALDKAQTVATETTKTAAVAAGEAARLSVTVAGGEGRRRHDNLAGRRKGCCRRVSVGLAAPVCRVAARSHCRSGSIYRSRSVRVVRSGHQLRAARHDRANPCR